MKSLRFLYWIGNPTTLGAERFYYLGWKHGILASGHFFYELTHAHKNWEDRINEVRPDIFFLTNLTDLTKTAPILAHARRKGVFIFLLVHMPLPEAQLRAIREYDPADVYFGEREEDCMIDFTKATGKRYVLIPNAADRLLHFPTPPADEYAFDVVFLGNRRTNKSQIFEDFLIPLCRDRRYRIGLFGPFWTKRDFVFAAAQKALYQIGLHRASKVVSDFRIAVPFDKENVLYSSAKICLNFHERESDGTQPHHVVNMRAFKIAACGGFQLCDRVHAMPRYFEEDKEIVMANDASEFRSKMDYFIRKDDMRRQISLRAAERAHRDHTYHNRVDLLIDILQGKHRLAGVPVLRA